MLSKGTGTAADEKSTNIKEYRQALLELKFMPLSPHAQTLDRLRCTHINRNELIFTLYLLHKAVATTGQSLCLKNIDRTCVA